MLDIMGRGARRQDGFPDSTDPFIENPEPWGTISAMSDGEFTVAEDLP